MKIVFKQRVLFVLVVLIVLTVSSVSSQSILVETYTERGKLAYQDSDYDTAEKLFKSALLEAEKLLNRELIANANVNLGKVYQSKGSFASAEPLYLKAISIFDDIDGKNGERSAFAINNLGLLYADSKQFAKSEEFLRKALLIREQVLGSDDPDVAITLLNLGKLYADQSKFTEADAVYVRSLQILVQHPDLVEEILVCLHNLALSTKALNNPKREESAYKMSIAIIEKNFGRDSPRLIEPLTAFAKFLRSKKRLSEAIVIERRSKLLKTQ